MKLYAICIYLLVALFTISCHQSGGNYSDGENFKESDFGDIVPLEGKEVPLEKVVMPSKIMLVPSRNLVLITEMSAGAQLAKIYSLDSLHYIRSFIGKGEGPDEQLSATSVQYVQEDDMIYISDLYKKRLFEYSPEALRGPDSTVLPVSSLNMRTAYLNKPLVLHHNKIVDLRHNLNKNEIGLLNFYNANGDITGYAGKFPAIRKTHAPHELLTVFSGSLNMTPDKSRLIVCYNYMDCIELYDTTGQLIKRVHGPDGFEPDFVSRTAGGMNMASPTKDARMAFRTLVAVNKDIYVLYDGGSAKREGYHVDRLLKFDENLKPVKEYKLAQPIFDFDIDPSTGILYGLTHESEGNILLYKL